METTTDLSNCGEYGVESEIDSTHLLAINHGDFKVTKVSIDEITFNCSESSQFKNVLDSIELNGLQNPLLIARKELVDVTLPKKYVCVGRPDALNAAADLGYNSIDAWILETEEDYKTTRRMLKRLSN